MATYATMAKFTDGTIGRMLNAANISFRLISGDDKCCQILYQIILWSVYVKDC